MRGISPRNGSGAHTSPQAFVDGLIPAIWVGVAVLGAGALAVLLLPFKTSAAQDAGAAEKDVLRGAPGGLVAGAGRTAPAGPAGRAGGAREPVVVGRNE